MKKEIKEIMFISIGAVSIVDTWSGIPFFLVRELSRRGVKIDVVDLEPNRFIKIIYNKCILPILSVFIRRGELSVYRTLFFRVYQYVVLKKALSRNGSADVILVVSSFNIAVPKVNKPIILFSDWPFSYVLQRNGLDVGWYQRLFIKEEDRCMKNSDLVLSLFPTCANYINKRLGVNNAISLGVNVVNNMKSKPSEKLIDKKSKKCKVVFIGRHHYLLGAIALLNIYKRLLSYISDVEFHIIGLSDKDFPDDIISGLGSGVKFWGFLDKGVQDQCELYYNILREASFYVNTTPGWVGYTSMIEAMYYYTPIIVYPCTEFIDEFGVDINFGKYCSKDEEILQSICQLWFEGNFKQFALNAHNKVDNYTWEQFTDRLLQTIEKI